MSSQVQYDYKPQGATLEQYILSEHQRTMIMGPLGSGKTNASCWKGFRIMCAQTPDKQGVRRTRGLAIRNTYPDLFGTTIKDWLDMFEPLGNFKNGGKEPPTHYLKFKLPDGTTVESEMVFLALDREDHVKKLRGFQGTFAWINEVKEIIWAIVSMMDLRMGRYPKDVRPTWHGIFGDTNACDTDHWYYRLAEEMKPAGWKFLRQPGGVMRKSQQHPWQPNPKAENVQNLPKDYYLNGAQGKQENWVLINLANEYGFVSDGMPVWPDYVDSVHCKEFELVPGLPIHIGMDFGLTPAAIVGQRMPNGQWRWRYEVVTTDTGIIRFARILKAFIAEKCPGYTIGRITGDPAGDQRQAGDEDERTVFQLLEAEQIVAEPAYTNEFAIRQEAVGEPMRRMIDGGPGFHIHPDCRVTRKGLQGAYKFRRLKVAGDERYENKPVKNANSHPCFVAGTMISVDGGAVPIETLRVGDVVETPVGPRVVVANMARAVDALVDVEITSGVTLRCTPDHPFAHPTGGFVRADALQYMDLLVSEGNPWLGLQSTRCKSSTACGTTASLPATTRQTTLAEASTFIELCGQLRTGLSRMASTCITWTRTRATALSEIWSSSQRRSTAGCTATSGTKTKCEPCWRQRVRSLLQRIEQWLEPKLQLIAVGAACFPARWSVTPACNAAANTSRALGQCEGASAAPPVSKPHDALRASTTSSASARTAGESSPSFATRQLPIAARVARVSPAGKGVVYNLEVAEAHCYYAGGVLVSNCEAGQYLMLGGGEGEAVLQVNSAERSKEAEAYRALRGLPTRDERDAEAAAFRRKRGLR